MQIVNYNLKEKNFSEIDALTLGEELISDNEVILSQLGF